MIDYPFYKTIASGEDHSDSYPINQFKGRIVWMSPTEYIIKVKKINQSAFKNSKLSSEELFRKVNPIRIHVVTKFVRDMKKGKKFPMPQIKVSDKSWDGVHRTLAAKEIGYKKIPIFMINPDPSNTKIRLPKIRIKS
jgi:hypothetical protein